ncbi:MAG: glycosyltransferase family 2 protein [Saprospiraceae bacterium]
MKVAGFTFVRNALRYDYPVVEAIRSILPLCDAVFVAVGRSDDDTLQLVQSIADPRIQIIQTVWDDALRKDGRVLAVETNKALDAIPPEYDWACYIQADECIHEDDLPQIRKAMRRYLDDPLTEGLLFNYRHFYGSYDYVGDSRRWYRREVRVIRNDKRIRSWRDAQGFRLLEHGRYRKLRVRHIPAYIHHYGWVRPPEALRRKIAHFESLYRPSAPEEERPVFAYDEKEPLARFAGSHPAVMQERIARLNWQFSGDPTRMRRPLKDRLSRFVEKLTGWRPGEYRNYKLLR